MLGNGKGMVDVNIDDNTSTVEETTACKRVVSLKTLHWLERSIIGKMKGDLQVDNIVNDLSKMGFGEVQVRKYSGVEYIITLKDHINFNNMKDENWKLLSNWFEDIVEWFDNSQIRSRVVWLACFGIPIHAWNLETFQNISEK
ncbi:hypothetical protein REPUB_Repub02eG0055500 [Reevesia pubescens]